MRKRDKVSLALPSLILRLMLAATFIWAGLGKLRATEPVDGETAALLANIGVVRPGTAPAADPNAPASPLPPTGGAGDAKPTDKPADKPADEKPADSKPGEGKTGGSVQRLEGANEPFVMLASYQPKESTPSGGATTPPAPSGPGTYAAKDFPNGATTLRVNTLAALMYRSAHPATAPDGSTPIATWPKQLGEGRVPVYLAWAVAITEIAAGGLVLIGLTTRLAAFALAGVMVGAIWLTQIGPAFATGKTLLGFLPAYEAFNVKQWMPLMWQVALLASAKALFFAGPGLLAIDNAIFSRPRTNDDHDGE